MSLTVSLRPGGGDGQPLRISIIGYGYPGTALRTVPKQITALTASEILLQFVAHVAECAGLSNGGQKHTMSAPTSSRVVMPLTAGSATAGA
jgi:hypothetical protein